MDEEQPRTRSNLGIFGMLLLIGGIATALYAFAGYDPTVGVYGITNDRVNNAGLLQRQAMLFDAGCISALAGVICLAVREILERIGR